MTTENIEVKENTHGGVRPGSGRPAGVKNRLSAKTILDAVQAIDKPFVEGFAEDYVKARMGDDPHLVLKYQQMIMNKVVADKVEIDVTDQGRLLEAKKEAFKAALEHFQKNIIDVTPTIVEPIVDTLQLSKAK